MPYQNHTAVEHESSVIAVATSQNIASGSDSLERLVRRIHVVPIGDEELHAAQEICWCHPTETEPRLWVHNAKDCRESKERATGEKCSDGWISVAEFIAPNAGDELPVPKPS